MRRPRSVRMSRNCQVDGTTPDTVAIRMGGAPCGERARRRASRRERRRRRGARGWTPDGCPPDRAGGFRRGVRSPRGDARVKPPRTEKTFRTGEGSESSRRDNRETPCAPDPGRGDARTHLCSRYLPGVSSPVRGVRCPSSRIAPALSGRRASASERGWDGCAFSHAHGDNFQGSRGNGTSATPSSRVARADGGENARANAP